MKVYTLQRQQLVHASIDAIWNFFSDARNLNLITPPYMNFRITSGNEGEPIHKGQLISYKVSPILGIPLSWTTEIADVKQHDYFIDTQKSGPYKLWHHEHHFIQQADGILMTDTVKYALPFSFLGSIAHSLFIKKQLKGIFDYRNAQIERLFNGAK